MGKIPPLELRRRPGLGRYTGSRADWKAAWRRARIRHRQGFHPDPKDRNLEWKASLVVTYERSEVVDLLTIGIHGRLAGHQAINKILEEKSSES